MDEQDHRTDDNRTRHPVAGGVFMLLSLLIGIVIGIMVGQISLGMAIGFGVGVAIAVTIWLIDRRRA